jgi:hypothetical protein
MFKKNKNYNIDPRIYRILKRFTFAFRSKALFSNEKSLSTGGCLYSLPRCNVDIQITAHQNVEKMTENVEK